MSWDASPENEVEVRQARQGLEAWLVQHPNKLTTSAVDSAVLVAGELIANAVRVARTSIVLSAAVETDEIVVEVSDDGAGDDELASRGRSLPDLERESGRGLFLVRELSLDVSILSTTEGTVIRCVLDAAGSVGSSASPSCATSTELPWPHVRASNLLRSLGCLFVLVERVANCIVIARRFERYD